MHAILTLNFSSHLWRNGKRTIIEWVQTFDHANHINALSVLLERFCECGGVAVAVDIMSHVRLISRAVGCPYSRSSIRAWTVLLSMKLMKIILSLLILTLVLYHCQADFMLEILVESITTSNSTNCGRDEYTPECETYLSTFCLREGRNSTSSDVADCPLGVASRTYYYCTSYEPAVRTIVSEQRWTVSCPQMVLS